MSKELSILVPGIRPHNWIDLYESTKIACTKYDYEIVFTGPIDPPAQLLENNNVKYFYSIRINLFQLNFEKYFDDFVRVIIAL